ncbi:hypothetical protein TNCV_2859641 [Trichonephila clavipes]|nr:hypothetical protein TNCV_2859641 [Trichonephila clavipes]
MAPFDPNCLDRPSKHQTGFRMKFRVQGEGDKCIKMCRTHLSDSLQKNRMEKKGCRRRVMVPQPIGELGLLAPTGRSHLRNAEGCGSGEGEAAADPVGEGLARIVFGFNRL